MVLEQKALLVRGWKGSMHGINEKRCVMAVISTHLQSNICTHPNVADSL